MAQLEAEEDDGLELPTKQNDEFRPFIRRLPEFKFWYSATKATFIGTQCSKIGKKVQCQKCKKALFACSKMVKNQFLHQKKVQMCNFRTFSGAKIDCFAIYENANNVFFFTFEIALFSNFRAL